MVCCGYRNKWHTCAITWREHLWLINRKWKTYKEKYGIEWWNPRFYRLNSKIKAKNRNVRPKVYFALKQEPNSYFALRIASRIVLSRPDCMYICIPSSPSLLLPTVQCSVVPIMICNNFNARVFVYIQHRQTLRSRWRRVQINITKQSNTLYSSWL